jgi:hypothetical protein
MAYFVWRMVYGVWCMSMVYRVWHMAYGEAFYPAYQLLCIRRYHHKERTTAHCSDRRFHRHDFSDLHERMWKCVKVCECVSAFVRTCMSGLRVYQCMSGMRVRFSCA